MDNKTLVAENLKRRAFIFMCSYKTAWEQFLEQDEKQQFTYDEINQHIATLPKRRCWI